MKTKLFSVLSILAVVAGLVGFTSVAMAAGAYGQAFTSSITYQNLGPAAANISVAFYPAGSSTPINVDLPQLPSLAGSSLFIGGVGSLGGTLTGGSAVMSSDQPLATTIVQVPGTVATNLGIKSRPLTNGMDTGSSAVNIPTVLANHFGVTSVFSVQNADAAAQNIDVQFIPAAGQPGTAFTSHMTNIASGSGQSFDLGTLSGSIGADFNGSVKITGTGPIVSTSIEYEIAGGKAYGFEGTGTGGPKVYMPSAFCQNGPSLISSNYAVQNTNATGGSDVTVAVTFTSSVSPFTSYVQNTFTIAPGQKASVNGCGVTGSASRPPSGFIGSAVITATNGNIVAIGKISDATLATAYLGFTAAPAKVSLPYVRWASAADWPTGSKQRTNIAIQNIGGATIPANQITVSYYGKDGTLLGTDTIPTDLLVGGKVSSNPTSHTSLTSFGFYPDGTTGGSAIVQGPAGSNLAVIARVQTYLTASSTAGEDYNGITAP